MTACLAVTHNEVSCKEAGIPVGEWCENCLKAHVPQFTSHSYIWYDNGWKFAPRFCYVDSEESPVDLLGSVWRYHPGFTHYVELQGDVWVAWASIRVNGAWTQTDYFPAGFLIDALTEKIVHTKNGKEIRKPLNFYAEEYTE